MIDVAALPRRLVIRFLGLPPGSGMLFTRPARIKLFLAVLGSFLVAGLEVLALAALVPLMAVITGQKPPARVVSAVSTVVDSPDSRDVVTALAALVLLLYLLKAVATIAFRWWLLGVMAHEQVAAGSRLFDYYLRAPYTLHLERGTPSLLTTMNDGVGQVFGLVVTGSILALSDLATIAAVVVTLLVVLPVPTLLAFGYFVLAAVVFQRWARPRLIAAGNDVIESAQLTFKYAIEGIGTIKEVHVRGSQDYYEGRYKAARTRSSQASRRSAFLTELPRYLMEILFIVGIGLMVVVAFSQSDVPTALATIAVLAAAGFRMLPSAVRAMASLNNVRVGRPALQRVLSDTHRAIALGPPPPPSDRMAFSRSLTIKDLHFAYEDGPEVLRGVSVEVPYGTSLALVGSSGAGKTTLVDLMLGLLTPTKGDICADGQSVFADIGGWRKNLGMVPQTVWLNEGTIRENVAFSQDPADVNDDDIWAALRTADLEGFVRDLPDGLDSEVGERGNRLSGGQLQRFGIARALYRAPRLMIMDEATSALDNETERRITDTMTSLSGELTLVVVAHRLSTVRYCDQIAFMSEGGIEAVGTFDELRERHEGFARLVELGSLA